MERKDIQYRAVESVGMDKSNGYSRRKYERQCDKHSLAGERSGVDPSELSSEYGVSEGFIVLQLWGGKKNNH
ncbi:hypothetical protein EYF80_003937 [Liparis tanakae]|uniref:Uncharacterized protein n=1 Tax=Liparis tanakae TaxID=230148 RepID=A0A4Z2J6B0_9TELE|nr:hypothetical protein EYF80_003937 [Liparis tanakae]